MTSSADNRATRSWVMSRILGRDTGPELLLRRFAWRLGLRYRLHDRIGRARPDLLFRGPRVAVFIDGCFWHGCPAHYVPPRSSRDFWSRKLRLNVERDRRVTAELERDGWRVIRLWEHQVESDPLQCAQRIAAIVGGEAGASRARELRVVRVDFLDSDGSKERRIMVPLRGKPAECATVRARSTAKWTRGTQAEALAGRRSRKPRS